MADFARRPPRRPRNPVELRAALLALSAGQRAAIWTDLSGGNPPKWARNVGPNIGALVVLHYLATTATLLPADAAEAKLRVAVLYLMDHTNWLINPAFDPTINVDGTAPLIA